MMMKRYGRLDQPLQKSLFKPFRFPPNVFPNLMRVIELARIEEQNPALITFNVHRIQTVERTLLSTPVIPDLIFI